MLSIQVPSNVQATTAVSLLTTKGTWIVNADGNVVLLRGINYPGYECRRQEVHTEDNYRLFRSMGFNVVRLPISWGRLEPKPGVFNFSYLSNYIRQDVEWAQENGMYVVLDMHQYGWPKPCGIPEWAVKQYSSNESGSVQFASNFWVNDTLQDHLSSVWTRIAREFESDSNVAGYDLFNEPWVYTSVLPYLNASHVNRFYLKIMQSIRTVDQNHIFFLEPSNMFSDLGVSDHIVWSPHFYTLAFSVTYSSDERKALEASIVAKYDTFVVQFKRPMWLGEFGAFMKDGTYQNWIQDTMELMDQYQLGWAWWGYKYEYNFIPSLLSSPVLSTALSASSSPSASGGALAANAFPRYLPCSRPIFQFLV
jgi:endoglycosylceramidase